MGKKRLINRLNSFDLLIQTILFTLPSPSVSPPIILHDLFKIKLDSSVDLPMLPSSPMISIHSSVVTAG